MIMARVSVRVTQVIIIRDRVRARLRLRLSVSGTAVLVPLRLTDAASDRMPCLTGCRVWPCVAYPVACVPAPHSCDLTLRTGDGPRE